MDQKLSTQPYKGSRDFYPKDMRERNYIFETWRKVCKTFGYEEYDGPFLESFDIYAAKSGEEIVKEQLYSFEDRGGRKVAIRPEMTPTLARMIANQYKNLLRPIRWFSIPNLWRYEKPQRGRLREHFQLNVDLFGVDGIEADTEIINILVQILKEFGATKDMFEIRVGNRKLTNDYYDKLGIDKEKAYQVSKAIDKRSKLSDEEFTDLLTEGAGITSEQVNKLNTFLSNPKEVISSLSKESTGAVEVEKLLKLTESSGIAEYVKYDPTIMRGFDYYTGTVFELFDLNPNNPRAMCGGGRYDDLVDLFIGEKLSGIGFGMGDVTFKNFLENWNLMPQFGEDAEYFITLWPAESAKESSKYYKAGIEIAAELRNRGKNTLTWLEPNTKLDKQLKFADKRGVKKAIIIGENELENNVLTVKSLENKSQETLTFEDFIKTL